MYRPYHVDGWEDLPAVGNDIAEIVSADYDETKDYAGLLYAILKASQIMTSGDTTIVESTYDTYPNFNDGDLAYAGTSIAINCKLSAMAQHLVSLGVPETAVVYRAQSYSTNNPNQLVEEIKVSDLLGMPDEIIGKSRIPTTDYALNVSDLHNTEHSETQYSGRMMFMELTPEEKKVFTDHGATIGDGYPYTIRSEIVVRIAS